MHAAEYASSSYVGVDASLPFCSSPLHISASAANAWVCRMLPACAWGVEEAQETLSRRAKQVCTAPPLTTPPRRPDTDAGRACQAPWGAPPASARTAARSAAAWTRRAARPCPPAAAKPLDGPGLRRRSPRDSTTHKQNTVLAWLAVRALGHAGNTSSLGCDTSYRAGPVDNLSSPHRG